MSTEKKAAAAKYHKKALMTAADRLLVEHGYDGMNMNMLAKEANYSKATVYVYFRSKDEIVAALCVERLKILRGELALVVKSDLDTAAKLAEVGSVFDEFAAEDGTYFDFVAARAFTKPEPQGDDGAGERAALSELKALVSGIFDDLTALAPEDELKRMWYEFYGRKKTAAMFDFGDTPS